MVMRWYASDLLAHLYPAAEIDDSGVEFLVPVGHTWPYAPVHPRNLLSRKQPPLPPWDICATCARWLCANRYSVLFAGNDSTS
ncbi:hypothetical protein GCM10009754_05160 [Amycolatopsis minnesotensis]|uniref:Uncharacterized protein n=1 Tax=Amycolatopsis minnesotensis TaxID=337894 RepID=A0ABN2Q3Z5_9PSEU